MPEICSGMLRIAPRAFHIQNPPPQFPPTLPKFFSGSLCQLTPPGKKSWIRPCTNGNIPSKVHAPISTPQERRGRSSDHEITTVHTGHNFIPQREATPQPVDPAVTHNRCRHHYCSERWTQSDALAHIDQHHGYLNRSRMLPIRLLCRPASAGQSTGRSIWPVSGENEHVLHNHSPQASTGSAIVSSRGLAIRTSPPPAPGVEVHN